MLDSRVPRHSARVKASSARPAPERAQPKQRAQERDDRKLKRSARPATADTTRHTRGGARPLAVLILMLLCSSLIISRLVFWQVMQHKRLTRMASAEHAAIYVQPPER